MRRDLLVVAGILGSASLVIFLLGSLGFSPFWVLGKAVVPSELSLLHFSSKPNDSSQLAQLKKENTVLLQQLSDLKKLQLDNAALHDQFATTQIRSTRLLPATIVGAPRLIPGISMPAYVILDKGTGDGVAKGQAVVYKNSIVGTISEINPGFSKVLLVTDPSVTSTARTQETNALGVVKGQSNGELVFDNVLLSDSLKIGDLVITNGDQSLDGKGYPPGLLLGKINSVDKNPSALFQKASIQSLIDPSKLRMVFILVK